MNCRKCGGRTKVLTTRHPHAPGNGWEVSVASPPIDWYTFDFIVRRRRCVSCNTSVFTAELIVEDITGMMRDAAAGHAPEIVVPREVLNER
tara:strand:+ start:81 stop:353 length:273 start_codon:yes stop_codon:yes gene_type:complete